MCGMNTSRVSLSESHRTYRLRIPPFAHLDALTKTAGFWGDMGDSVWNSTMKPIGNAVGQARQGLGQIGNGVSEAVGNTMAAPGRALGGAIQGAANSLRQQVGQPGDVNLGAVGQGMMDSGWNAGRQALGAAGAGAAKARQGAGNVLGGIGSAAWGTNPVVMGTRAAQGLGHGLVQGVQNFANSARNGMAPQPGGSPQLQGGGMQLNASTSLGPPAPSFMPPPSGNPQQQAAAPGMSPVGSQGAAPRMPMGQQGPAGAGGTDWRARFRKDTGTDFNERSPMDQRNMENLQNAQPTMNLQQWQGAGRPRSKGMYKGAALTAFAACGMTKEAMTGLSAMVSKALTSGAKGLASSAGKAKRAVGKEAYKAVTGGVHPRAKPDIAAARQLTQEAMAGIGNNRMAAAGKLKGAEKALAGSPNAQKAINYGIPAVGGGAALYGSNRLGHSSGLDEGLDKGFDTGATYGIQAAQQNAPKDPGVLGRIMSVFSGQEAGPQPAALQALLDSNKAQILQQLRGA